MAGRRLPFWISGGDALLREVDEPMSASVLRLSALSPLAFMVPLCTATALAAAPGALHVADATHLFPGATWHASDDVLRGAAMVVLACTLCFAAARVRAPFWIIGLALVPLVAWLPLHVSLNGPASALVVLSIAVLGAIGALSAVLPLGRAIALHLAWCACACSIAGASEGSAVATSLFAAGASSAMATAVLMSYRRAHTEMIVIGGLAALEAGLALRVIDGAPALLSAMLLAPAAGIGLGAALSLAMLRGARAFGARTAVAASLSLALGLALAAEPGPLAAITSRAFAVRAPEPDLRESVLVGGTAYRSTAVMLDDGTLVRDSLDGELGLVSLPAHATVRHARLLSTLMRPGDSVRVVLTDASGGRTAVRFAVVYGVRPVTGWSGYPILRQMSDAQSLYVVSGDTREIVVEPVPVAPPTVRLATTSSVPGVELDAASVDDVVQQALGPTFYASLFAIGALSLTLGGWLLALAGRREARRAIAAPVLWSYRDGAPPRRARGVLGAMRIVRRSAPRALAEIFALGTLSLAVMAVVLELAIWLASR